MIAVCSYDPQFSSVQSLSHVQLFVTPWTAARQASLSTTNSQSLPKPMSIDLMMPSNHLIFCRPLLLLPSIFPSIRVFSNETALHIRWPKYWSFSFNISPSNEHPGLISFRMDCLDLLAVQGTLQESSPTPQFKSINSSALSFLYSPTLTSIHDHWKNHSLTRQTLGEGNGTPLQYSYLENPRDRGAWQAAVYGVTQSWTRLKWLSSSSMADSCWGFYRKQQNSVKQLSFN